MEQDAAKAQALADELKLQVPSTIRMWRESTGTADPISLVPDLETYFNGQSWGFHNAEEKRDIEYGLGDSNALERQYLDWQGLGAAQQATSPLK